MKTAAYAQGWYLVAFSKELGPTEVKPVRYFGQEFVLYRTEAGEPVLMEAFCPHLGAHLGHGGKVEGDAIRCPFHAWKFDKGGRCTEVPYAKRIPPRAEVKVRTLREQNGMILGFFGPADAQPDYEIPLLPQLDDPAWTALETDQAVIKTEPREVIENIADRAHFLPVHATKIDEFEVIIDGPRATQRTLGKGRNLRGEKIDVVSVATYHGPAIQFTDLAWAYPMMLVNAHIPIDKDRLLLRFGVAVKTGVGVVLPPEVMSAVVAAARDGYFQDVAIWENKKWRDTPVLADGDGPIGRIRDWYKGFFAEASA
ncbi:MAG: Rieske 2Fe-2S domain-containing protein [Myxococcales bacterium]|nr:Rieske 2Fe-2S domain-containing protein [Myxococcales bacterium]MCB9630228.1 Rieske 2Fe-2S domain-containing protein [Sandaracinaceae bacterium]